MAPKFVVEHESIPQIKRKESTGYFKAEIIWKNVFIMSGLHITGLYGLYLLITSAKWQTMIFTYIWHLFCGFVVFRRIIIEKYLMFFLFGIQLTGITAGVHRLWSHRSYEAKPQLRFLLMLSHSGAFQNSILGWCRDHRAHHKYSETNADPHNSHRGFFFSHCGWLLVKKHPDVVNKRETVNCSDIQRDPIVQFQIKYFNQLMLLMFIIVPTIIPYYIWNETFWNSFFILVCFRNILTQNITCDATINPRESLLAHLTHGEGFHNYHHVFPWDYRASEYASGINWTSYYIEFFAKIGWAYNLKTVDQDMIEKRKRRTGDKFSDL